jgi:hypothetical protein
MAVSVEAHHRMVQSLMEVHGAEEAAALVQQLAPHDVATKADVDAVRHDLALDRAESAAAWAAFEAQMARDAADLRADVHEDAERFRTTMRHEWASFRADLSGTVEDLRVELTGLRGEMGDLRDGLRGEMGDLRDEVHQLRYDTAMGFVRFAAAVRGAMDQLVAHLDGKIADSESRLWARIDRLEDKLDHTVRWLVGGWITILLALVALAARGG